MKYFRKISVLYYVITIISLIFLGFNQANAALNFSSEEIFKTRTTHYESVAGLYNGRFVVAYDDEDAGNYYGTAALCDHSGNNQPNCFYESVFNSGLTLYIQVARLQGTVFAVVYRNASGNGIVRLGSVGRASINWGTAYTFNSSSTYEPYVTRLSNTKFLITYRDSSNNGYAVACTNSGQTISSCGSSVQFASSMYSFSNSLASLVEDSDPYKFVSVYTDSSSGDGRAIIGTVTDTPTANTISFGDYTSDYNTFDSSGTVQWVAADDLSEDKYVISYTDASDSYKGYSVIGDVTGTSISHGARYPFNNASSQYLDVAALDQYTFVTAYRDGDNVNRGTGITGYVTNNVISYGSETVYNSGGNSIYNGISYIPSSSQLFAIAYRDVANSNYGTAVMGQEDAPGGPAVPEFASLAIQIFSGLAGLMVVIFIGIYIKKKIDDRKQKK